MFYQIENINDLYPEIAPFHHFHLDVGDGHELYVEQCGNPEGQPVLFVHGGPGMGCSEKDRRFFHPAKYHIVLFDQRGCGRSRPHGSLEQNNTSELIADIEKIRQHLNIDSWHLFGGSWGSTLSLLYAQAVPERIKSMVLRGIFLARQQDIQWAFAGGGATRVFSDYWQEYKAALADATGDTNVAYHNNVEIAYKVMTGEDKTAAFKVAKAWSRWEIASCTLVPNQEFLEASTSDESAWTLARHEAHFMVNQCFLQEDQILKNCANIAHIPTIIVHGRYDMVCPFDNAMLLHDKLPRSELVVSQTAGHASIEPETKHHLLSATSKMLQL